jgi:methionyl-tRNA formyltransferase
MVARQPHRAGPWPDLFTTKTTKSTKFTKNRPALKPGSRVPGSFAIALFPDLRVRCREQSGLETARIRWKGRRERSRIR